MKDFYNKHYINVNELGCILNGWSDGPHPEREATDQTQLLTDKGGYQFRLFHGGEENPSLTNEDGIPIYKWKDGHVISRSDEEIEADRLAIPDPAPTKMEKIRADIDFIAAISGVEL